MGQVVVTMRKVKLFREGGTVSVEPEMRRRRRRQFQESVGEKGSRPSNVLPPVPSQNTDGRQKPLTKDSPAS